MEVLHIQTHLPHRVLFANAGQHVTFVVCWTQRLGQYMQALVAYGRQLLHGPDATNSSHLLMTMRSYSVVLLRREGLTERTQRPLYFYDGKVSTSVWSVCCILVTAHAVRDGARGLLCNSHECRVSEPSSPNKHPWDWCWQTDPIALMRMQRGATGNCVKCKDTSD